MGSLFKREIVEVPDIILGYVSSYDVASRHQKATYIVNIANELKKIATIEGQAKVERIVEQFTQAALRQLKEQLSKSNSDDEPFAVVLNAISEQLGEDDE